MEQPVSSRENSPLKQNFRRPQVALFRCSPNPKDYEQRRERQAQGIKKAKDEGMYKGRPVDADLHKRVAELLKAGLGIRATARHADCSTTTVLRIRDKV
ncbi:putative transposon DNA-invertase [compost metagenome]